MSTVVNNRYKDPSPKHKASAEALYELVFLLRHDISEHDAIEFCKYINGIINNLGGSIKKTEYWGLRQLAYRVNKNTKAHYYFWQINSSNSLNTELARVFGVSDKSLRHAIFRVSSLLENQSSMLTSLKADIESGTTVYSEKYEYNA